jgi:heme-degrading monooxygenase HmoA
MIVDSSASLSIYSVTRSAADISRALGVEPTESHEIGSPRRAPRSDAHGGILHTVWENSHWSIDAPPPNGDEEPDSFSCLMRLAGILGDKVDVLARLREDCETVIWYSGRSDSSQGGFVFPADVLLAIARLGCELCGTAYLSDGHPNGLVVEQAVLPIKPGRESEFEVAFEDAKWIISEMPGFRELTLSRGVERPETYLLLVRWDTVDDHEVGFRGSPGYKEWRARLHEFYEPFPVVEHYAEVTRVLSS